MAKRKKLLTDSERIAKLEQNLAVTNGRLLQCERMLRVIGQEFADTHLSEDLHRRWARRTHQLSSALREVRDNLKRHGNEFDREPYITDPEQDFRWREA